MTIFQYILKSLIYYRKQHIALFFGTLISATVLTGGLIIGDSVSHSLTKLVDVRLGNAKFALVAGDRFVRNELSDELAQKLKIKTASLLMMNGIAVNTEKQTRINTIQVLGIDDTFWKLSDITIQELSEDEVIISSNVAQKLELNIGDEFLLRAEKVSIVPLNTPLVAEQDPSVSMRVKIVGIANNDNLGRFSLKSNQAAPFNMFVSKEYLGNKMELEGMCNVIITSDNPENNLNPEELNESIAEFWQLKDAGIAIREVPESQQIEVLSERIFMDNPISDALLDLEYKGETLLTYLINIISTKTKETPYSFVTAFSNSDELGSLKDDEIVVNEWLADDLNVSVNDTIQIDYFVIGPLRTIEEKRSSFIIKKVIPIQGDFANNSLMPLFPGLADAKTCNEWEAGIPIDLERIRDKDEEYWNDYKGTPKAFISMDKGLELWRNKFGDYTSVRFQLSEISSERLEKEILTNINPTSLNLSFVPVYNQGIKAASNSVDFGELFLSLSFFIIVAGILLTVLIYTLNTESRMEETGILAGIGFSTKKIIKIRILESLVIIVISSVIGAFAGVFYNLLIIKTINSIWMDIVRADMLEVYIKPSTLFIGAISGIIIALLSIYFVTRKKLKNPVFTLIKGTYNKTQRNIRRSSWLNRILIFVSLIGVVSILAYSIITSVDQNASLFLSAGALFILGCTALLSEYFVRLDKKTTNQLLNLQQLALKNASRNKGRSLAIVVLLALGTFSVVITGSNRKTFYGVENARSSGTGGFMFWSETSVPIIHNLNTEAGKQKLGFEYDTIAKYIEFVQMHQLDGDDASCLNLNQVQKPKILGINPDDFNRRNAFSFAKFNNGINKDNPWIELDTSYGYNVIPAFADQTVITWGLMKKVGDTLNYITESGEELKLVLIGGLNSSIFQGNVLIADNHFMNHFPTVSGSKIMLIESPQVNKEEVAEVIQTNLFDYGVELTSTSDKLAEFNSVTNTYLSIFMALGGLGVIIGTIGLGIVLLRNLIERRQELALLKAIGFNKSKLFNLLFIENIVLLFLGLLIGVFSAFIGILPSLISPSFTLPVNSILIFLGIIFISGVIWIYIPLKSILKKPLMKHLRLE